jgi:hypothetical protein
MEYNLKILQIVLAISSFFWLLLAFLFYERGIFEAIQFCIGILAIVITGFFLVLIYRKYTHRDLIHLWTQTLEKSRFFKRAPEHLSRMKLAND